MSSSGPGRVWLLGTLLVLSEALYLALLRFDAVNGIRPVLTFLGLMAALFVLYLAAVRIIGDAPGNDRFALKIIAIGTVLFRLTLLPAGLPHDASLATLPHSLRADVLGEEVVYERFILFDHDIWRYLWDGHVWTHGVNPYSYAPADAALGFLADEENAAGTDGRGVWADIRENINHPATPTIYPPLAQAVFRLAHLLSPGSVLTMKCLLVGFDLLTALFIARALGALGRPVSWVLLYAWNPPIIKAFAGSGHADAMAAAALAATAYFLARRRQTSAAISFALAILAKISPLILAPFVARRTGWRNTALAGLVLVLGYVPFLGAGRAVFDGLWAFGREWEFNAGPFALLRWLCGSLSANPDLPARMISALAILAVVAWLWKSDDGRAESFAHPAAWALGALLIFSPTVMPWYLAWVLPLGVIANQRVWIYFSALVCLAFLVMVDGREHAWVLLLEYGLLAVCLWFESRRAGQLRSALMSWSPRPTLCSR